MILLGGGREETENSAICFKGFLLKEVQIGQNLLLKGTVRLLLGIKETTLSPIYNFKQGPVMEMMKFGLPLNGNG